MPVGLVSWLRCPSPRDLRCPGLRDFIIQQHPCSGSGDFERILLQLMHRNAALAQGRHSCRSTEPWPKDSMRTAQSCPSKHRGGA